MSASPTSLLDALPRLQIVDQSTPSKPNNYRTSPISASSTGSVSVFQDWSGRGSHVDFAHDEKPPLEEGRFLGQGVMGPVHETFIRGHAFAWKRRFCRRQIGEVERKEIEILKKLSHTHIIQLIGTYTWRQFLGLLLFPVAVCDLHTFFEGFETIWSDKALDPAQRALMSSLGLSSTEYKSWHSSAQNYLWSKMGCITSAVEYLHSKKIRHKDLKPSNILLSRDRLWLTDFGSATDFSTLSMSVTENGERGTPKYFAPEVASFQPSGRSADIFSLGCVLLEICVLISIGSLQPLQKLRPRPDFSYQANLAKTQDWFFLLIHWTSGHSRHLATEIRQMLSLDPRLRPTAPEVRRQLSHIDSYRAEEKEASLFGECCRVPFISTTQHEAKLDSLKKQFLQQIERLKSDQAHEVARLRQEFDSFKKEASLRQANDERTIRTLTISGSRKEHISFSERSTPSLRKGSAQNSLRRQNTLPELRAQNRSPPLREENSRRKEAISPDSAPDTDEEYRLRVQRELERSGRSTPRNREYDDSRKEKDGQRREGRSNNVPDGLTYDGYGTNANSLEYHCPLCSRICQSSSHLRHHIRKRHEADTRGARHSNENMRKKQSAEHMRRRHSYNLLRRVSSQRIIGE